MQLTTDEFEKQFENYPLYSQDGVKDPVVSAKLFIAWITWYLTEYDKNSKTAFWYTTGLAEDEFWYTHIPELEEIRLQGLFEVERDLYFTPAPLTTLLMGDTKEKAKRILGHK